MKVKMVIARTPDGRPAGVPGGRSNLAPAGIANDVMIKDEVKAVLQRVPTWPEDRQRELLEVALEIEAELAGADYDATSDELAAIDEGLAGEAAGEQDVEAVFAQFRKATSERLLEVISIPIVP